MVIAFQSVYLKVFPNINHIQQLWIYICILNIVFWWAKIWLKHNNGLKSVIKNLHHQKYRLTEWRMKLTCWSNNKRKCLSWKSCIASQVNYYDGKTLEIMFTIALLPIICCRSPVTITYLQVSKGCLGKRLGTIYTAISNTEACF